MASWKLAPQRIAMKQHPIYLDHNATTTLEPHVIEAMLDCYRSGYANPASQHRQGQKARRTLDDARDCIASLLGARLGVADADRVIITSGGTEANNLAIRGLASDKTGNIVISSLEHPCVTAAAEHVAKQRNVELRRLPASHDGLCRTEMISAMIDDKTFLASVMLANHETGVVQPVDRVVEACREHKTIVHTDAAQAVGKLPVDFQKLEVDALTISAHKFGGPIGVGALILRHGVSVKPVLFGGFQQLGLRPGTESVALAVGMKVALEHAIKELDSRRAKYFEVRDEFERQLLTHIPNLLIHGASADRLPQTSCISFLGVDRQALMMALDMADVACSTGSACASGSSEPSPVLEAMGCSEEGKNSAIRFSFGTQNTLPEAIQAANRITNVVNNLRR
jgi:cysteine desulfurase